jgi:hypothetical protein
MTLRTCQSVPRCSATSLNRVAVSYLRVAIVIVAIVGCSSHEPLRVPANHRAVAAACTEPRGPGTVTGKLRFEADKNLAVHQHVALLFLPRS